MRPVGVAEKPGKPHREPSQTLTALRRPGGALWRAYQLKKALREVFAGDLEPAAVIELLARWCSRTQRSRIPSSSRLPPPSANTTTASSQRPRPE